MVVSQVSTRHSPLRSLGYREDTEGTSDQIGTLINWAVPVQNDNDDGPIVTQQPQSVFRIITMGGGEYKNQKSSS